MPASHICICPPIQIHFQSSLRVEEVLNGIAILHITMLSGGKLPKLPLSQVHVGTGNCLTVATLSSSKIFFPLRFLTCPKFLPFATEQELNGYQQQQEESRKVLDLYSTPRCVPKELQDLKLSHRLVQPEKLSRILGANMQYLLHVHPLPKSNSQFLLKKAFTLTFNEGQVASSHWRDFCIRVSESCSQSQQWGLALCRQ